jgi:hypothetical protein
MLSIGLQANPQYEFFNPIAGTVDWIYCAELFFGWFGFVTALSCLLVGAFTWAIKRFI